MPKKETVFSKRLKELRGRRGLTQQQIVDKLGFVVGTTQVYSNYENGQREPSYEVLCKLAGFFGVTTDYLLGLSGEELPQMQEITVATGLSATAISNISVLPKDERDRLSDLLEHWYLLAALRDLDFLCKIVNTGKDLTSVLSSSLDAVREDFGIGSDHWERVTQAVSNRATKSKAEERYARFEVIDTFTKLIDFLYPLNDYDQITDICHSEDTQLKIARMEQYARSIGDNGLADFIAGKGEWMEK